MNIFKIENAYKQYGNNVVLNNVNISVEDGEVVSIIGTSGSGKTTLLNCLTLLDKMDSGSLSYLNNVVASNNNGKSEYIKDLGKIRRNFSMVFQNFNLFPHFTVLKNLCDAPINVLGKDKDEVKKQALQILQKLGLNGKENLYPYQLSGGMKQRVSIARSLMMEPKIIFFDEPTSALDPEYTNEVLKVIKDLKKEKMTMLIVSHEMRFVKEISDRIIFMNDGVIVEEGSPSDIFDNPKQERTRKFVNARVNNEIM